jgi:threonylcarbamoyladenosine tRNA methylthiotransferase MtaB
MESFYVHNLGCRANQADGAAIEAQLRVRGFKSAVSPAAASLVVLNTCTVTAAADSDARHMIRRLRRENPACRILVTGCYAQRAPYEIASLDGVTWVVANSHKARIGEIVFGDYRSCAEPLPADLDPITSPGGAPADAPSGARAPYEASVRTSMRDLVPLETLSRGAVAEQTPLQGVRSGPAAVFAGNILEQREVLLAPHFAANDRTRPNLKVQDGCDNRCSFCIIPFVRGGSRSLPLERAIAQVQALVAAGYREIVVSGINLGQWGRELRPRQRFHDLLVAILRQTGIERLRVSSVEPMDWDDELIALLASEPRMARHAHVPLQSGADGVLRRMHRRYRPWHYAEKIARIRRAVPDAAIGADVMAGFPGETEAEFCETVEFIRRLPFTYLHVFSYSERPGTGTAAQSASGNSQWMSLQPEVIAERSRALRALAAAKSAEFRRRFIRRDLPVITLEAGSSRYTRALSDNYIPVRLPPGLAGNVLGTARIVGLEGGELVGGFPADSPTVRQCEQVNVYPNQSVAQPDAACSRV